MDRLKVGTLMVIISAAGFSTLAIFIKIAYAVGANIITIMTVRFSLAAALLWIILKRKGSPLLVPSKTLMQLSLLGILGFGTMSVLFALTLQYISASLGAMLLYTYPAIVCVLSFMIGDESFTWQKGIALTICLSGLFLILGVSFENIDFVGILLGVGTAITYSCYIIAGNRILKSVEPLLASMYVCLSAGVIFILACLVTGDFIWKLPLQGWLAILGITFFAAIVGIIGFFEGMSRIGAAKASIISTIEPVITVILSVLLLDETLSTIQVTGGLLILAGILIIQARTVKNST